MRTRHSGLWKRKPGYSQQFPCCGRFAERISISFQFMFLSGYPIPIQAFATLPVSCGLCQRKLCLPVATITLLNSAQPPTQTIARRVENSLVTAFFFVFFLTCGYNKGDAPLLEKIHIQVNQPGTSLNPWIDFKE